MARPHQRIDHSNTSTRLTCTGSHYQQEVPLFLLDAFKHRANGAYLVVAPSNRGVDEFLRQRLTIAADIGKAFQIITRGKPNHFAWGRVFQIPKIEFMAVGVEAEWQFTTQLPLDVVAILLRLLTTNGRITACLFGLNHR